MATESERVGDVTLLLKNLLFTFLVPGTVAVLVPLWITAGDSLFRGLAINRFEQSGMIFIDGAGGNVVEGNYLGTDVLGTSRFDPVFPGGTAGVITRSNENIIGGEKPASRNVISGLTGTGVVLHRRDAATRRLHGLLDFVTRVHVHLDEGTVLGEANLGGAG